MKKINLGFIGAGFISQQCHLPSFSIQKTVNISSLAEPKDDLRHRICEQYAIKNQYKSHKELLKNENLNAVVVTLPRDHTYSVVKDCLEAGKHVLSEKPLSLNYKNASNLKKIAKKNNLVLKVGYMKRNDDGVKKFKNIIQKNIHKGKLPIIVKSSCYMGDSYCNPIGDIKSKSEIIKVGIKKENFPSFKFNKMRKGYENFINTYSHTLDALNFIFNQKLTLIKSDISYEGFGITLLKIGGIVCEFSSAKLTSNKWFEEIQVIFEDEIHTLKFPPALLKNVPATIISQEGKNSFEKRIIRPKWSWSFINQANEFLNEVKNLNLDRQTLDSAIEVLKFSEKIFKTLRT